VRGGGGWLVGNMTDLLFFSLCHVERMHTFSTMIIYVE
jgi:hypothetical protein